MERVMIEFVMYFFGAFFLIVGFITFCGLTVIIYDSKKMKKIKGDNNGS